MIYFSFAFLELNNGRIHTLTVKSTALLDSSMLTDEIYGIYRTFYMISVLVDVEMRFVKQAINIPVRNVDESTSAFSEPNARRHSDLLPNSIRCIIAGPSNCGKTNLLVSLIESEHGLKFENLYIYSKTLEQDKYKYLTELLTPINGIGLYTFSSGDKVLAPKDTKRNSIIVFDDVICEKNQQNIKNFYCLGRHRNIDCFYLTQTYTRVSKHLIRDNCNFIIVFRQDDLNLRHIYNDMGVACDMKFVEFRQFCLKCWREKYGFVVIDLDSDVSAGRYRMGFSNYLNL